MGNFTNKTLNQTKCSRKSLLLLSLPSPPLPTRLRPCKSKLTPRSIPLSRPRPSKNGASSRTSLTSTDSSTPASRHEQVIGNTTRPSPISFDLCNEQYKSSIARLSTDHRCYQRTISSHQADRLVSRAGALLREYHWIVPLMGKGIIQELCA